MLEHSASSTSTVTLGKRKRGGSLVLHLSSPSPSGHENDGIYTESEYDPGHTSDLHVDASSSGKGKVKRRYACQFAGCTKAYSKPSRLAEHERSHTGDVRPALRCFTKRNLTRPCSVLLFAQHAVNPTCVRIIFKPIPAHIYRALPSPSPVKNLNAESGSGHPNIFVYTLSYIEARSHSRCVFVLLPGRNYTHPGSCSVLSGIAMPPSPNTTNCETTYVPRTRLQARSHTAASTQAARSPSQRIRNCLLTRGRMMVRVPPFLSQTAITTLVSQRNDILVFTSPAFHQRAPRLHISRHGPLCSIIRELHTHQPVRTTLAKARRSPSTKAFVRISSFTLSANKKESSTILPAQDQTMRRSDLVKGGAAVKSAETGYARWTDAEKTSNRFVPPLSPSH